MGKGKLAKFADMERYENVFQYPFSVADNVPFDMKGHWREMYFKNDNPIVLELGCGKGEYTVGLAKMLSAPEAPKIPAAEPFPLWSKTNKINKMHAI